MSSTHSKTPYEIRLNLLELANTIEHNRGLADPKSSAVNTPPTVEAVVKAAEALNKFVSQSD